MTKCLLLVTMIIFVISKSAAADEPITKKYQNDLAASGVGNGGLRQDGPLKLAMGPVSAPHLPSGSPNTSAAPSSGCQSAGDSCTNQRVKVPRQHKHHK
jgi:hypothetical protein